MRVHINCSRFFPTLHLNWTPQTPRQSRAAFILGMFSTNIALFRKTDILASAINQLTAHTRACMVCQIYYAYSSAFSDRRKSATTLCPTYMTLILCENPLDMATVLRLLYGRFLHPSERQIYRVVFGDNKKVSDKVWLGKMPYTCIYYFGYEV